MEKTQQKPTVRESIRRFIINTEPIVGHLAKKAHKRMAHVPAAPHGKPIDAAMLMAASTRCRCRGDWLGVSIAQLRMGSTEGAIKTLTEIYPFSRNSALSFIGHISGMDGRHRTAAKLFYAGGKNDKVIGECSAIGEEAMTIRDRRLLALAYARTGQFMLASAQFRHLGSIKLANRLNEIGMIQAAMPMQTRYGAMMPSYLHWQPGQD
jgi:hypothetical protein